jgi:hypothetical protein
LEGPFGIASIVDALDTINKRMEKNDTLRNIAERSKVKNANINNRNLIKNTHSITEILNKIYGKIDSYVENKNLENIDKKFGVLLSKESVRRQGNRKIENRLDDILGQVKRMSGNKFTGVSPRGARLTEENFRRRPQRDERVKGLESISRSVEIIERLRSISLRDFVFAKRKLRNIMGIMTDALNTFRIFKNKKEAEATISFTDSSIDIMKKLAKVSIFAVPAKIGARAMEEIYLGGKSEKKNRRNVGGLLGLFKKISKSTPEILVARKMSSTIEKTCGSMFLTSVILTGIAVVGIPAMAGALLMKGIIWILTGVFKMLGKPKVIASITKGSTVLLIMSASIITFGLGLGLMALAVKNMKLKDVGLIALSLASVGLTVAGLGLLAVPIAAGSGTLLLMGASLGIFALSIMAWQKIDSKKAMGNVKEAIGGLREALGLELGKHDEKKNFIQRIGGGIVDVAMSFINMGSTFFMMGTLLFAGFALGMLYHGLKKWDRFDGKKAAANIKVGIGALKEALGIEGAKGETEGGLKKLGGGILDMGLSLLQGSKALIDVGVITVATAMADLIKLTLIPWEKYDARPAATNLKIGIGALKEVFGLEDVKGNTKGWQGKLGGSLLDMGLALLNGASELAKVGTITIATGMSVLIKKSLESWDEYDPTKAIGNMSTAVTSLVGLFGLEDKGNGFKSKIGNLAGSMLDLGASLINGGGVLAKMGTITLATGMLTKVRENLVAWEDYNATAPIDNIRIAVDGLLSTFGLSKIERQTEETAQMAKKSKGFWETIGDGLKAPFKIAGAIADAAENASENGQAMNKISRILNATSSMFSIKGSLEPWDNYNSGPAITNIDDAVSGINRLFANIVNIRNRELPNSNESNAAYFESSTRKISKGIKNLADAWKKSEILKSTEVPFKKTVDVIKAVDMSKAKVLIELFDSFSKINKKPFDKFTTAVNKFADSSSDLIEALNHFSENYTMSESSNEGESGSGEPTLKKTEGININNTEALAAALAEAMKSIPINVETSISDVRLVVNNEAGRRVILTLEN